jgi:putative ABC transport system permease protein
VSTARWRKVRSDLFSNRARSALAVLSLAVGTVAVGTMHLAGTTINSSFTAGFLGANPPSANLGTDPFPATLLEDLADHPSVGDVEGRRLLDVRARDSRGRWVNMQLVAMTDFTQNRVAVIRPSTGEWPPTPGTVVIERASVGELGAGLGDTVEIELPGQAPTELEVAGTALDIYEVTPMFGGFIRGYVSMQTVEQLTGTDDLNTLFLRAATDPLERDSAIEMAAAVRDDVLAPQDVAILWSEIRDPSVHRADNAVSFMVSAMQVLSLLTLAVAVALVVNTVSALLSQQRRHIGVMKAVGARSGQLTMQYLGYVLLLAVVALAISVPISIVAGRVLAGVLANMANFELEPLTVPWATIGLQFAIVTVLPVLAVFVTVRRAARLTVQETIVDRGITGAASRRRVPTPLARPTLLAYRNAVRNRSRLVLTVAAIALCGGILVGVLSTGRSLNRLTDEVAGYSDYGIEVTFTDPVDIDEVIAAFGDDPAVAGVEGWYTSQAFRIRPDGSENENISITSAPVDSPSLRPTLLDGRWLEPGDEYALVVNIHLLDEEPDLRPGSDVVLDIKGRRNVWRVVGVATTTLVGPVAYVSVDDLTRTIDDPGRATLAAVQLTPGADPVAVAERIESAARAAGLPVSEVRTNAEVRAMLDELMTLVVTLLLSVGAIFAVVAVIGVAGTMTLSVVEQTREIGVLRTLGASSWAVRRMLMLQGLAIAALGAVVGVVASIPIAWLLSTAIGNSLVATPLPQSFSWLGVGIWVPVALVIGALGATRPARVAARLTIRDTLAYE